MKPGTPGAQGTDLALFLKGWILDTRNQLGPRCLSSALAAAPSEASSKHARHQTERQSFSRLWGPGCCRTSGIRSFPGCFSTCEVGLRSWPSNRRLSTCAPRPAGKRRVVAPSSAPRGRPLGDGGGPAPAGLWLCGAPSLLCDPSCAPPHPPVRPQIAHLLPAVPPPLGFPVSEMGKEPP